MMRCPGTHGTTTRAARNVILASRHGQRCCGCREGASRTTATTSSRPLSWPSSPSFSTWTDEKPSTVTEGSGDDAEMRQHEQKGWHETSSPSRRGPPSQRRHASTTTTTERDTPTVKQERRKQRLQNHKQQQQWNFSGLRGDDDFRRYTRKAYFSTRANNSLNAKAGGGVVEITPSAVQTGSSTSPSASADNSKSTISAAPRVAAAADYSKSFSSLAAAIPDTDDDGDVEEQDWDRSDGERLLLLQQLARQEVINNTVGNARLSETGPSSAATMRHVRGNNNKGNSNILVTHHPALNSRHCRTYTCEEEDIAEKQDTTTAIEKQLDWTKAAAAATSDTISFPCGEVKKIKKKIVVNNVMDQQRGQTEEIVVVEEEELPPELPEPKYSVRRRVLPTDTSLTALNSRRGYRWLTECLVKETARSYIALTEHFVNQGDPAFCGVTTLLMVLNAMSVDPNMRWKGGWRYYGDETVLLSQCCITQERIQRIGITMEEFQRLASCQGLRVVMKRPPAPSTTEREQDPVHGGVSPTSPTENETTYTEDDFRNDIRSVLCGSNDEDDGGIIVVSFSREVLGQTGDGHFSPLAAYHEDTDRVLVLDVARFKYQPYWVPVSQMYDALLPLDAVSKLPRGWYVMQPPRSGGSRPNNKAKSKSGDMNKTSPSASTKAAVEMGSEIIPDDGVVDTDKIGSGAIVTEGRRPARLVPVAGKDPVPCPVHKIKIEFCQSSSATSSMTTPVSATTTNSTADTSRTTPSST